MHAAFSNARSVRLRTGSPPISIIVFEAPPLFIRAELPAATKIAAVFITFPTLFFQVFKCVCLKRA